MLSRVEARVIGHHYFHTSNFEKVGSILVSACPSVRPSAFFSEVRV